MVTSSETAGFYTLKVKFRPDCQSHHYVFFKPHNVRSDEPKKPRDRTIFAANIPPWMTRQNLQKIFQPNGPIEAVYLQNQPSTGSPPEASDSLFPDADDPYRLGRGGFRYAYIVFKKPSGQRNCTTKMNLSEVRVCNTEDKAKQTLVGVRKWCQEYNQQLLDEEKLMDEINAYMKDHDEKVAREKVEMDEMGQPDDEGWITVTKQDKKKGKKMRDDDKDKDKKGRRKKKKQHLQNFYAFQVKEDKLNRIQELRKKFEEDKKKIAKMKTERKFRPF